jgi:hypothetical protein
MSTLPAALTSQSPCNRRYVVTIKDLFLNRELDQKERSAVIGGGWIGDIFRMASPTTSHGVDGESTNDRHKSELQGYIP